MKKIMLLFVVLLLAGCAAAKTARPLAAPALQPVEISIDPISDTRAILKYDRGEGIENNGSDKAAEAIASFCKGSKHRVLVSGERPTYENRITRIIVFECEGESVPVPAPPADQTVPHQP